MDFEKLYEDMLMRTPDNMDCSLPVIVEKEGEQRVAWAHFTMDEKEGVISAHVKKIYMADPYDGYDVVIEEQDVQIDTPIEDSDNPEDEPKIGNHDYIKKLGGLLKKFSVIAMQELLRIAVHRSMLVVYDHIINFCMNVNWASVLFTASAEIPELERDNDDDTVE